MLITFSDHAALAAGCPLDMETPLMNIAESIVGGGRVALTWAKGLEVRFTLPGASSTQHEAVILALLILDPRATIRTSRALYRGLADYKRQNGHDPADGALDTARQP